MHLDGRVGRGGRARPADHPARGPQRPRPAGRPARPGQDRRRGRRVGPRRLPARARPWPSASPGSSRRRGRRAWRSASSPARWPARSLKTDRAKLKQVVSNLLSNALRYTEAGPHPAPTASGTATRSGSPSRTPGSGSPRRTRRGSSRSSRGWTTRTARRARGRGWAWRSADGWPASSAARSPWRASRAGAAPSPWPCRPRSWSPEAPAGPAPGRRRRRPPRPRGSVVVVEDNLSSRQTLARVLRRMGYRVLRGGQRPRRPGPDPPGPADASS